MTDQNPTRRRGWKVLADGREPLNPARPQEAYDLSDWDERLLDDLADELDHHDIAHEWDHGLLSVYAADERQADDLLSRFIAARQAIGQRLPNPFGDPDG
jgi:hypothetical protein